MTDTNASADATTETLDPSADERRMAEEIRAQEAERVRAVERFNAELAHDGLWGHAPRIATRKTKPSILAADVKPGDRVRISYYDYDEQRGRTGWATVLVSALAPSTGGCIYPPPPPVVHLLMEGPDDCRRRIKEVKASARVEVTTQLGSEAA